jgi:cytochrome c oxidase cbb3-type subunit 3
MLLDLRRTRYALIGLTTTLSLCAQTITLAPGQTRNGNQAQGQAQQSRCGSNRKAWLPRWETMAPQITLVPESGAARDGRGDFQTLGCSRCHGLDADGGTGPDLLRSAVVRGDACGDEIRKLILSGRPARGMPPTVLNDAQVFDIVDYLHARVDEIDFSTQRSSEIERMLLSGDPNLGQMYFNGAGGCSGCHSPTGDLKGIGSKYDPLTLELRFIAPIPKATITLTSGQKFRGQLLSLDSANVSILGDNGQKQTWQRDTVRVDAPPKVSVTLPSGQSFRGQLLSIDSFDVSIQDEDGWNHTWRRDTVKVDNPDTLEAHRERLSKYSDADLHNLLAFLEKLK